MQHTNQAPHDIKCQCDNCLEYTHSYHYNYTGPDIEDMIPMPVDNCLLCQGAELPHNVPVIDSTECFTCHTIQQYTGRERTIEAHRDPTASYELACGHWVI